VGTANIPNAKEYQKKNVGEYNLDEDLRNLYNVESESREIRDPSSEKGSSSLEERSSESLASEQLAEEVANW
jgi:hypothetical protein